MTANTKNLFFCFWLELSTRFYFYMKSNLTIFILVKYITLKLAFMKKSHFWGRSVWISNSHNGRTKQNLAKIFYKLHFIQNMNIICENKQILSWSVFFFSWNCLILSENAVNSYSAIYEQKRGSIFFCWRREINL